MLGLNMATFLVQNVTNKVTKILCKDFMAPNSTFEKTAYEKITGFQEISFCHFRRNNFEMTLVWFPVTYPK